MAQLSPRGFLSVASLTVIVALAASAMLPHDPYIRFQALARESVHYLRVKWIYERVHFDATPIDVAFIGTSHTQSGIDSEFVQASMLAAGIDEKVVNFAVPHLGRDLEYLIARELLENRKVKTLVIEVQESEARAPHPGFQRLATVSDLLGAPLILNTGIADNFVRLPLRQIELSARTVAPSFFEMNRNFDARHYEGQHWNDTYRLHGIEAPRTAVHDRQYFEPELKQLRQTLAQKQDTARRFNLPFMKFNLLTRYNDIYLERIVELAQQKSARVIFLYLPFLGQTSMPQHAEWLQHYGQIIVPWQILSDSSLWQNADHLNVMGARQLSGWVAEQIKALKH